MLQINRPTAKNKILIILLVLIAFTLSVVILLQEYKAGQLRGVKIKHIFVAGKEYKIENGRFLDTENRLVKDYRVRNKIYSLGLFYKLAVEEPVVADKSLDNSALVESLNAIEKYQNKIAKNSNFEGEIIPLKFLCGFLEASKQAKKLENRIDAESVDKLNKVLVETVQEYKASINQKKTTIEKLKRENKTVSFNGLAVATNTSIALSDMELMIKNADALEKEIDYRVKIANGKTIPRLNWGEQRAKNINDVSFSSVLRLEDLYINQSNYKNLTGPFLTKSKCTDGINEEKPFYVYYPSKHVEGNYLVPKLANNNYFWKLDKTKEPENNFVLAGFDWEPVSDGYSYKCQSDNEYQGLLLNIDQYLKKYPKTYISVGEINNKYKLNSYHKKKLDEVSENEQRFYGEKAFSTENLEKLGENYKSLYGILKKYGFNDGELLDRYLIIRNKTLKLDQLFNSTFWLNMYAYLTEKQEIKPEHKASNDFLLATVRSNYAISYLNFSPLIWRLKEKPTYSVAYQSQEKEKTIVDYEEIKKILPLDVIGRMMWIEAKNDYPI